MKRIFTWSDGRGFATVALAVVVLGVAGCNDKPGAGVTLAPTSTGLAVVIAAPVGAVGFTVDKATSKVEFTMDAPREKIRGRVSGATEGGLQINLEDVTKTTGLLSVDIGGIELYQTVADDSGKFATETKSDLQNKHARTWLEISDDTPEGARKENSRVQFAIKMIETKGEKNVLKMAGAERKVMVTAMGDFLLHGRKTAKAVELAATFVFDGDRPVSVAVKTVKPFAVGLVEHDVKPRDAFGRLAAKTLKELSSKVTEEALVSIDVRALAPAKTTP